MIKEVSQAKFEAMIRKDIQIRQCPICQRSGEIVIKMPQYGASGAMVKCTHCENQTRLFPIHINIECEGMIGNPTNERSLMRGIRSAISSWNAGAEKAEKARRGWS